MIEVMIDLPDVPPSVSPNASLGPEDFDALDFALDAMREHDEDIPQWEFCEGFMIALICTRRSIEPAEYWPMLLGEGFAPARHMEFVWRWKRRWREIESALDADVESLDDERALIPSMIDLRGAIAALPEEERGELNAKEAPSYGLVWALGFLAVPRTWPEEWAAPRDREAARLLEEALDAIHALLREDTGEPAIALHDEDGPPGVSEQRFDDLGEAIWAVYDLRQLWRSLGPRGQAIRKEATPGRNDLCPCGSGKKYKKCHGR
jgi:uncharacterized protein